MAELGSGVSTDLGAGAPSLAAEAGGQGGLFVRKATGLVRELSVRDNVLLNLGFIAFPLGFLMLTVVPSAFPGANVTLAFVLAALLVIPHTITYGMLSMALPRSGGDYLFISRALHPSIGFVASVLFTYIICSGNAFIALFVPSFALPAMFQSIGLLSGNEWWTNLATDVSSDNGVFIIGVVLVVLGGLLTMLSLRAAMRVFIVVMFTSIVGAIVTAVSLLSISRDQFVDNFAKYGSYDGVLAAADKAGFGYSGVEFTPSLMSFFFLSSVLGFAVVASYWAGEVRGARNVMVRILLLTLGIASVCFIAIAFLTERSFGNEFLGASSFVSGDPEAWPLTVTPFLNLFIVVGIPHTWLAVLLGVTYVSGILALLIPTFLLGTRNVLAYSIERVLPGRLSEVNSRTHTPINATILVMVIMIVYMALYVYPFESFFLVASAVSAFFILSTFALSGIAAVVFPYRQRAIYEASTIKWEWGGVPVLSIVGGISAIIMTAFVIFLMFTKWGDSIGATDPTGIKYLVSLIVVAAAVWLIAWAVSRRRGVSLTLTNRELPPE
jgi:amino acid transporter